MNIYFLGIGGISMSALATICRDRGHKVSGSDIHLSETVQKLIDLGIPVNIGHTKKDFSDIELVVFNSAISPDNPELAAARSQNVPCVKRAQLLGSIMAEYPFGIAVSGMHGKTTTTAMIAQILYKYDPTVHLGGEFKLIGGNFRIGKSVYFVTEACEYKRNFLYLKPYISVILNIDEDHMDYFKDIEDIQDAFSEFAANTKRNGVVIVNGEDSRAVASAALTMRRYVTYGIGEGFDYSAHNLKADEAGNYSFDFYKYNRKLCRISLKVPGKYNVYNALAAAASANIFNISVKRISTALSEFKGVDRRYQYLGEYNGARIIADYAHHPKELDAAIGAAKAQSGNVITVFQPHTYSRTKSLRNEFKKSLKKSDSLILLPIYAAREPLDPEISSLSLSQELTKEGKETLYFENFEACADYLKQILKPGDLLLIAGAGDIIELKNYLI
ncbi:MAG TPA: UDP-N-acetylmuramate--L-alanine ligase [Clostridia bacterium]